MPTNISIKFLADYPHLISTVGEIRWKEWGHPPEPESLDWWVKVTERQSGRDHLPVTWVAIDDQNQAVGAVGLAEFDIEERHDRTPWVIGMIVVDDNRNRGIGAQLLAALEQFASQAGYSQIWVATGEPAVGFYQKCGWMLTEIIQRPHGETPKILSKSI
ncbi:MAG: GNAT family N-acetyltransferase [Anaerolineaceae bacterium]|nr:GNAT family N-acetyltransferase [Anaerolineaceae bacterium]